MDLNEFYFRQSTWQMFVVFCFLNNASTPNQGQNKWIKLKMTSVQLDIANSGWCANEEERAASYEDGWSKTILFDLLLKEE